MLKGGGCQPGGTWLESFEKCWYLGPIPRDSDLPCPGRCRGICIKKKKKKLCRKFWCVVRVENHCSGQTGRPSAQCYRSLSTTLESHFVSCTIPCTSVTYPPSDSHGQYKLCHLWQGASAAICHTMRLFSALLCLSSSSRRSWSKKLSMFTDCLEENAKCILQVKAKPGILKHIGSIFNIFLLTLQGETA